MKFSKEHYALMGEKVKVTQRMIAGRYGRERRHYQQSTKARTGWVIGLRYVQDGYIESLGLDGNYFVPKKFIPVLKVCFWPTMKPIDVPLDGYSLDVNEEPHPPRAVWSEKDRKTLSKESYNWPRDSRGRWV